MKAECAAIHERLSALADGELEGAERDLAERHLAGCAECRALLARWQRLDGTVGELAPPPASEARWARMSNEIKQAVRERGAVRREARLVRAPASRGRAIAFALAAAAAVAFAVWLAWPAGGRGRDFSSAESVAVNATGENCQTLVMAAPEGGLNLVIVTSNSPDADGEERAGG